MVVNVHPNISRERFDGLKAILTNCIRHGPASQNRSGVADFRAWLRGSVSQVATVNSARGAKLQALYDRIQWQEARP